MASQDYMKELQKLEELSSSGFISDDEYQRRKSSLLENAGVGSPFLSQLRLHPRGSGTRNKKDDKDEIIVCFMLSGQDKYTNMVLKAIKSFQRVSPDIAVGLLVPDHLDISSFLSQLAHPEMIHKRSIQTHFANWNPTQHKLDIIKFADEFSTIFWLDSDTYIIQDMTRFLLDFHLSSKQFALIKDRVNYYDEFKGNWPGNKEDLFIAQACFMGFKADSMKELFTQWEELWNEWIVPTPFSKFKDPYPSFPGSTFCIEQYALGMAIQKIIANQFDTLVQIIPRYDIVVEGNMSLEEIASTLLGSPTAIQTNTTVRSLTSGQTTTATTGSSQVQTNAQGVVTSSYLLSSAALAAMGMGTGTGSENVVSSSYLYQSSSGLGGVFGSSTPIVPGAIVVVRFVDSC
jgi:hypothetical protein